MGKTILLADDSVTIHKVVELTFLDEDYSVEAVGSAEEAIARLEADAPDLVIADVHMPPGPTGYEVCDKVRELHPGVPVLLLAGAFEPFDEARAATADAHLKKPFDSQKLLQTVQQLMADAEAASAPPAQGGVAEPEAEAAAAEPAFAPEAVAEPPTASAVVAEAAAGVSGEAAGPPAAPAESGDLSPAAIDAIAQRVVELMGDQVVREVAWEVVPDLAEVVVKDRLRELEEAGD